MQILIRHTEETDVKALKDLYEQQHIIDGTMQLPFPSNAMWASVLGNSLDNRKNIVAIVGGNIVGHLLVEVHTNPRRKHAATLGVVVDKSTLGKGVGSALVKAALELCDNWLNISRIELQVYVDNVPAIRLYRKHGFEIEGTHKNFAFKAGHYADVYSMARLCPEI